MRYCPAISIVRALHGTVRALQGTAVRALHGTAAATLPEPEALLRLAAL